METPLSKTMETGSGNSGQTLMYLWPVFDGLTYMDHEGNVRPGLATSYKPVEDRAWEFTLGDYKFHNGREVTAEDVVQTYARYRDPNNSFSVASAFATVDKVEAVDNKTVRITTKAPDPTLPNILSLAMILPMREVEQQGAVEFFRKPIGSGPFRVEEADFSTVVRYTAMGPDFKTPRGVPNVQEIEARFIPEPAARAAALQTGEVDIAFPLVDDQIAGFQSSNFNIIRQANTATVHFLLDPISGPTQDVRVRQAINYAVDKELAIQQLLGGNGRIDAQMIGPGCLGYNPELQPYPYDLAKARQLMAEAGYANGFSAPMTAITTTTGSKEIAEFVAAQLAEIGIETDISVKEVAVWLTEMYGTRDKRKGIWVEVLNWEQTFEANSTWRWYSSDIPVDTGRRWDDEEFDRHYQLAKTNFDRSEREKHYKEAGKRLREQAPVLFLWQNIRVGASKPDVNWDPAQSATGFVSLLSRA